MLHGERESPRCGTGECVLCRLLPPNISHPALHLLFHRNKMLLRNGGMKMKMRLGRSAPHGAAVARLLVVGGGRTVSRRRSLVTHATAASTTSSSAGAAPDAMLATARVPTTPAGGVSPTSAALRLASSPSAYKETRHEVVFYVNGQRHAPKTVEPDITLIDYLRQQGLTGTKLACGEGLHLLLRVLLRFRSFSITLT